MQPLCHSATLPPKRISIFSLPFPENGHVVRFPGLRAPPASPASPASRRRLARASEALEDGTVVPVTEEQLPQLQELPGTSEREI